MRRCFDCHLGCNRANFRLQRYLATCRQHGHDNRHIPDGVPYPEHSESGTLALQVKLSELILSLQNADDKLAFVEDTAETDLEEIHDDLKSRAQNHPDN